ncbi:MAG: YigZ family protein [Candidatus Neomarinimicrobiota bacterium]
MSKIPTTSARITFKEKRSEFIGIIVPCESQQEFSDDLKRLKKEFHDASHICWAYRLRLSTGPEELSSDAGEPTGTAGLPLLNALRSAEIENGVVFVIRYFGGTKLGKRGLMEAYGGAAEQVIASVKKAVYEHKEIYWIECPLEFYGEAHQALIGAGGRILVDRSTDRILWDTEIPSSAVNGLISALRDGTRGAAILKREERT